MNNKKKSFFKRKKQIELKMNSNRDLGRGYNRKSPVMILRKVVFIKQEQASMKNEPLMKQKSF